MRGPETDGERFAADCIRIAREQSARELEPYYCDFVSMMTAMDLHEKSDIAQVMAYMAKTIQECSVAIQQSVDLLGAVVKRDMCDKHSQAFTDMLEALVELAGPELSGESNNACKGYETLHLRVTWGELRRARAAIEKARKEMGE